jgi:hypothetical protein
MGGIDSDTQRRQAENGLGATSPVSSNVRINVFALPRFAQRHSKRSANVDEFQRKFLAAVLEWGKNKKYPPVDKDLMDAVIKTFAEYGRQDGQKRMEEISVKDHIAISRKGGKAGWAGMSKAERSAEGKRRWAVRRKKQAEREREAKPATGAVLEQRA